MANETFFFGTLTFGGSPVGVVDVSLKETNTEHNVTTLETTFPESEFKAGRRVWDISFTALHKANTATLTTRTATAVVFTLDDGTGADNTYTGSLILFTKEIKSSQDGRDEIAYTGKFTGALSEANNPAA